MKLTKQERQVAKKLNEMKKENITLVNFFIDGYNEDSVEINKALKGLVEKGLIKVIRENNYGTTYEVIVNLDEILVVKGITGKMTIESWESRDEKYNSIRFDLTSKKCECEDYMGMLANELYDALEKEGYEPNDMGVYEKDCVVIVDMKQERGFMQGIYEDLRYIFKEFKKSYKIR